MKTLHLPFHFHRPDGQHVSAKLHELVHSDRFWAIVGFILLLALFVLVSVVAMRSGAELTSGSPYLF